MCACEFSVHVSCVRMCAVCESGAVGVVEVCAWACRQVMSKMGCHTVCVREVISCISSNESPG